MHFIGAFVSLFLTNKKLRVHKGSRNYKNGFLIKYFNNLVPRTCLMNYGFKKNYRNSISKINLRNRKIFCMNVNRTKNTHSIQIDACDAYLVKEDLCCRIKNIEEKISKNKLVATNEHVGKDVFSKPTASTSLSAINSPRYSVACVQKARIFVPKNRIPNPVFPSVLDSRFPESSFFIPREEQNTFLQLQNGRIDPVQALRLFPNSIGMAYLAAKIDVRSLRHAGLSVKWDKNFALAAIKENALAFLYLGEVLHWDRDIVLAAVRKDSQILTHSSHIFRGDREIVLEAVKKDGLMLAHANRTLQNDRGLVLVAIRENALALEYASAELKSDRDIVVTAMMQNIMALQYADIRFRGDKMFMLDAVSLSSKALFCSSASLLNDRIFLLSAIQRNPDAFIEINKKMNLKKDFVLDAVKMNGILIACINEVFLHDKDILIAAIRQCADFIHFAPDYLKEDKDLILAASESYNRVLNQIYFGNNIGHTLHFS